MRNNINLMGRFTAQQKPNAHSLHRFLIKALCSLFLFFGSCVLPSNNSNTDNTPNNPPNNTPGNGAVPTPSAALRSIPMAASTSAPKVLDSYTDGSKNYYLIDVGYIRNTYVSDVVAPVHFNGITPMSLSKTTVTDNTVAQALRNTVTTSITQSNTNSTKVGIEAAWKSTVGVGKLGSEFSVGIKVEWSGSWTNSSTNTRSSETSITETRRYSESLSISFSIGNNGEPEGYYRYALYSISDIYFILSTSLDNQELLSWDTVACVREGSFLPHLDYTIDGYFDNSPTENDITFTEDFYKTLPKPSANPVFSVTDTAQWNDALTAIRNGGSGTAASPKIYNIIVNGNVSVTGFNPYPGTLDSIFDSAQNIEVILKGSGTLSLNSNGNILRLGSHQKLIIDDALLTLQGRNNNSNPLLYVGEGASFELKNGVITGNVSLHTTSGGGVYVAKTGTFTMSGGNITSNTAGNGGGVYVATRGTSFTMSGGNIAGNTAYSGGGVFVGPEGTFTMTGGTISGNTALEVYPSSGGGVFVYRYIPPSNGGGGVKGGNFTKTGGTIYGYNANDTVNSNVVRGASGVVQSNSGHAVHAGEKRKETTAGPAVNLSYDGSNGSFSGVWDNFSN